MKLKITVLGQEINLLKIEKHETKNYKGEFVYTNHLQVTFDNSQIILYQYSDKTYTKSISLGYGGNCHMNAEERFVEIQLRDIENVKDFIKSIEQIIRNTCDVTACIQDMNNLHTVILAKAILFNSIEKYFHLELDGEDLSIKNIQESTSEKFDKSYSDYLEQFIQLKIKSILIKKDGLRMKTKDFCKIELLNE